MEKLRVLLRAEEIRARVAEIGSEISRDFQGEPVLFLGVLKGSAIFLADLVREVDLDATFDFIGVASYGNRNDAAWESTGEVRLTKDVDQSLEGKNVVLVEDILDTGLTLTYLRNVLLAHIPKSLKIAVVLDKPSRRKLPVAADYVGFTIADEFVVGYGLDYAQRYRNLRDVCVLERQ